MKNGLIFLAWLCLASLGYAAPLPEVQPSVPVTETTLLRQLPEVLEPLTLDDVLRSVEERHPKIRGAALMRDIAAAKVTEKQGAFDPQLGIGSTYQLYNSSSTPGSAKDYISNGIVVARQEPNGIKWEGGWINNQGTVKSPASATGDVGEFFLQAKIPFLRGAGINDKSVALEQARLFEEQTLETYHALRLLTLLDAGLAYLQWNASVMQWRILQENEGLALERAEQVQKRIAAGDLPAIDQVEADREVFKRKELTLKAARDVQKTALKLALYLWSTSGVGENVPQAPQAPLALPPVRRWTTEDVYTLQLEALAARPELRELKLSKSIVELDKDLAENDRLPQLDLTLRPGYDAGGQGVGLTMKAGLELVIPLATRGPDGRRQAALLKLDKLELEQVEMVRRILIQVQDAASEAEGAAQRLEQAIAVYQTSQQLEEAERTKFRLGDSTLFLVNARERSTLEAALKVLSIRLEHAEAQIILEAVAGQI